MPRQVTHIFLIVTAVFIAYYVYNANSARLDLQNKFFAEKTALADLKKDNDKLQSDIEYFSDPRNLEKQARERFNYRAPNEKMIIVAPAENSGSNN